MKKKQLKNLNLKKYRISNLTLLNYKIGGAVGNDTTQNTANTGTEVTMDLGCSVPNGSDVSECHTSLMVDCVCQTNTGATRAQPPSEHQGCNTKPNFGNEH